MGWRDVAGASFMEKVENAEKEPAHTPHIPLISHIPEKLSRETVNQSNSHIPHFPHIPAVAENENILESASLPRELEWLIAHVTQHYDCTPAEIKEIREVANRDMNGVLTAYWAMAVEIAEQDTRNDQERGAGMVFCQECSRLVAGHCMAARAGKIKDATRDYTPVREIFRRCGEYQPKEIQQWA